MNAKVCDWCTRTSRVETRVRCIGRLPITGRTCGAERILEHAGRCFVCGSHAYERVTPGPGDVPAILADLTQLVGDLIVADDTPENRALVSALAAATVAHQRTIPMREITPT